MDGETEDPRSRTFVTAFARGLDVILAFGPGASRLTLSEVALRAGVDRAVARRALLTLVELGYARSEGKHFSLTPKVLRLGQAFLGGEDMARQLRPALDALAQRIGQNASLTVLDYPDILHIARAEPPASAFRFALKTSERMPATATASGRVLMAGLPESEVLALLQRAPLPRFTARSVTSLAAMMAALRQCRAQGFAVLDGELEEGFVSAAVPLLDQGGRLRAAVATSSHSTRLDADRLAQEIVPLMREAAREMGSAIF
ncbi:helix-turn-helix domain-containing protein [Acetobacteraceae bacterium H6797]|nr:helix-turn-helix domain-containing protein [Acetobacteraceae bacterium H6797]